MEFPDSESINSDGDDVFNQDNCCIVCLVPRLTTWIFMPCRHVDCCSTCSQTIKELGQSCPVCLSTIENRLADTFTFVFFVHRIISLLHYNKIQIKPNKYAGIILYLIITI